MFASTDNIAMRTQMTTQKQLCDTTSMAITKAFFAQARNMAQTMPEKIATDGPAVH